jgi:hypothetical protein
MYREFKSKLDADIRRADRAKRAGVKPPPLTPPTPVLEIRGAGFCYRLVLDRMGCLFDARRGAWITSNSATAERARAIIAGELAAWDGPINPRLSGSNVRLFATTDEAKRVAVLQYLQEHGYDTSMTFGSAIASEVCDALFPEIPALS